MRDRITGTYEHERGTIVAEFERSLDGCELTDLRFNGVELSDEGLAALCEAEGTTPSLVTEALLWSATDADLWPAEDESYFVRDFEMSDLDRMAELELALEEVGS